MTTVVIKGEEYRVVSFYPVFLLPSLRLFVSMGPLGTIIGIVVSVNHCSVVTYVENRGTV